MAAEEVIQVRCLMDYPCQQLCLADGPCNIAIGQPSRQARCLILSAGFEARQFNDKNILIPHDAKTTDNFKGGLEGSGFKADTYELPNVKIPESWWEMAIAQRLLQQVPGDGARRRLVS